MAGLKRRVRVEGWTLDVSDPDEGISSSFMQRLADNNKLWVASLLVVLVVAGFLLMYSKKQGSRKNEDLYKPPPAQLMFGAYGDSPHQDFAADFRKEFPSAAEAHFVDTGKFVIVVASDTSADDIEHLSKMAAEKNVAKFRNRIVVEVYRSSLPSKTNTLVCVTKWETDRYGFVPEFIEPGK